MKRYNSNIEVKICKMEGCDNPRYSKDYCKYHHYKEKGKKTTIKKTVKSQEEIQEGKELQQKDHEFYMGIWEERPHVCYECGCLINGPTTLNFHHILPKRNYPQFRHEPRNIVILCGDCHTQVETFIDKAHKVKALTQLTKKILLEDE